MKTSHSFSVARRLCLAMLTAGALTAPLASHAQLQEITYLLPAPGTLPAFGPWMVAQAKGYYKAEGLDVNFVAGTRRRGCGQAGGRRQCRDGRRHR